MVSFRLDGLYIQWMVSVSPYMGDKEKKHNFFYLANAFEKTSEFDTGLHFHHQYLTFFSGDILILLFEARTIVLAPPKHRRSRWSCSPFLADLRGTMSPLTMGVLVCFDYQPAEEWGFLGEEAAV